MIKKIRKLLSSQKAIAAIEMVIAVVTLFQAIDKLADTHRQIGFRRDKKR